MNLLQEYAKWNLGNETLKKRKSKSGSMRETLVKKHTAFPLSALAETQYF